MNNQEIEFYKFGIYDLICECDPIAKNLEYKKMLNDIDKVKIELEKTLSDRQREKLEKIIDLNLEMSCFLDDLSFKMGFESSQFVRRLENI